MKQLIKTVENILQAQKELFESYGYCLWRTKESFAKDIETMDNIKKYVR